MDSVEMAAEFFCFRCVSRWCFGPWDFVHESTKQFWGAFGTCNWTPFPITWIWLR